MDPTLLLVSAIAAAIYVLTPGPAVLALLSIGAAKGRPAGAAFLFGHLAGDILWASLALLAIIGARTIDPRFFDVLGLVCGLYLFYLGLRAVLARRTEDGSVDSGPVRPLRRGLVLGITNPKGYPVAVAMFTALLADHSGSLSWQGAPVLLLAALVGFLLADLFLIWLTGLRLLRRLYRRYEIWIVRATGLLFIAFSLQAFASSLPGLLGRQK